MSPATTARSDATLTAMLALNGAHEQETSSLDRAGLEVLLDRAFHWTAPGAGQDALLIAHDQDAGTDSVNFRWFAARYPRFVYIDRIIVAPHARGSGLARRLYDDLFAAMRTHGHTLATCEINVEPPNPASHALHGTLGFAEVGGARLASGKRVRYQTLEL